MKSIVLVFFDMSIENRNYTELKSYSQETNELQKCLIYINQETLSD